MSEQQTNPASSTGASSAPAAGSAEQTAAAPLEHFVLFSSVLSVLGGAGQANYTAACAAVDALALERTARGIVWGAFNNAESIEIRADPNRYLPGGTAARPQTALNPNAGRLYIEAFPHGAQFRRDPRGSTPRPGSPARSRR